MRGVEHASAEREHACNVRELLREHVAMRSRWCSGRGTRPHVKWLVSNTPQRKSRREQWLPSPLLLPCPSPPPTTTTITATTSTSTVTTTGAVHAGARQGWRPHTSTQRNTHTHTTHTHTNVATLHSHILSFSSHKRQQRTRRKRQERAKLTSVERVNITRITHVLVVRMYILAYLHTPIPRGVAGDWEFLAAHSSTHTNTHIHSHSLPQMRSTAHSESLQATLAHALGSCVRACVGGRTREHTVTAPGGPHTSRATAPRRVFCLVHVGQSILMMVTFEKTAAGAGLRTDFTFAMAASLSGLLADITWT
jgi:hypothetical protein